MRPHVIPLLLVLALGPVTMADVHGQDIPEMSPEATAEFAEGMTRYASAEYSAAAEAFARAWQLDPTFAVAAFFEGVNWGNAGESERAREAYARALEGRDRMTPYYQHRLAAQMASQEGDFAGYVEENRKAAAYAPESKAVYNVGQGHWRQRRPRAAVDALTTLDPDRPPMKGWFSYWSVLARAQHQAGDHEGGLRTATDARRRFPDRVLGYYLHAEALAALGRTEELAEVVDDFQDLDAPFDIFLVNIAAEAEAHGHDALSRDLLDRAMQHYAGMTEELASRNGPRNWKAIAHYSRGEMAEADALFRGLVDENPENDGWRAWLGILAAERGDRAAAEAEIRRLTDAAAAGNTATRSFYAASVAAALGDGDRFEELIGQALDAGLGFNVWDHKHPVYRKVRDHPGYAAFARPAG